MSYITNADIEERLGTALYIQLTDDTGTGSADTDVVDSARDEAEGEANSYLAQRYKVPVNLTTYPELAEVLKGFTLDLVEYRLHTRRPPVTDDVVAKHEASVEWFRDVADGEVSLPAATTVSPNTASGRRGQAVGDDRLLSRGELEGY